MVSEWLGSVAESTAGRYLVVFSGFMDWIEGGNSVLELDGYAGSLPGRLLGFQKVLNRNGEGRKAILRASYSYIKGVGNERRWRTGYRKKVLSTIRSFMVYHLDETGYPKEKNTKIASVLRSSQKKAKKTLSLVELKQVAIKSSHMYRAVIKGMLVSGMGMDEIVEFSNQGMSVLKEAMMNPVDDGVIEIYLGPRKMNVENEFYVYIGGGAYRELRNWLKVREKKESIFNDPDLKARREKRSQGVREFPDSIFVTNTYTPLSTKGLYMYFSRKIEQLGFIEKKENGTTGTRYEKNPHQIRSLFRTQWSKSRRNPDIGEYFMGHTVDSLDYNRAHNESDYRINEYLSALPYLDMDSERAFGQVDEAEVESLNNQIKVMQAQIDSMKPYVEIFKRMTKDGEIVVKQKVAPAEL